MYDHLNCYSVLVISSSMNFNNSISKYLKTYNFNEVTYTSDLGMAKRTINEKRFDFLIINSPIGTDSLVKYTLEISPVSGPITLLFIKDSIYNDSLEQLTNAGIFVVSKPCSEVSINYAFNWLISAHNRFIKIKKKAISIESKMQEIRIINKAKWMLIENENMNEEKAHKEIEKMSMNLCVSKKEISEIIIKKYSK